MISYLDTYKKSFIECASGLGNYEELDETTLANGYCDAIDSHNEELSNQYYAALMLRYWYKIYKYKETCKSTRLEDEDFISWLEDALNIAFKYRDWKNPNKSIYGDPKAVDKIINRCCFSIRGYYYQEFNKDKRKINYLTDSIEGQLQEFGDSAEANFGVVDEDFWLNDFIKKLINEDKLEEAIIVDNIAYQDSFKDESVSYYVEEPEENIEENEDDFEEKEVKMVKNKYINTISTFSKRKLKKELNSLSSGETEEEKKQYFNYFKNKYKIESSDRLEKALHFFEELKDKPMYLFIDNTLDLLKSKLKETLCL